MICPHCNQPVVTVPASEYPASTQSCPACGVATHIEGEGFTARPEHITGNVNRYTCMRCGHVREVEFPETV